MAAMQLAALKNINSLDSEMATESNNNEGERPVDEIEGFVENSKIIYFMSLANVSDNANLYADHIQLRRQQNRRRPRVLFTGEQVGLFENCLRIGLIIGCKVGGAI